MESINRKQYYVSFMDDHSQYTNIYFLHLKDETFTSYKIYEAWLNTQQNTKIKCLWSDRGGEYLDDEFSAHLKSSGTVRKLTIHGTPEHNGVSEWLNRTLMEKVWVMLHESGLLKFLWAEAVPHAVYLKNRTWTRTLGYMTPYEILHGHKPNVGNLHPWGCKVHVSREVESKLDGRSFVGRWMGFDAESRDGHRVYWPEKRKVSVERNVKFNFAPDEVVVGSLPLEGEEDDSERLTDHGPGPGPDPSIEPVIEAKDDQGVATEPENSQNRSKIRQINPDNRATDDELTKGRGKHI